MIPPGPLHVPKLTAPPRLTWTVPGSKSITNRALLLAALADGKSELEGVLESDDTRHMRTALEALGIRVSARDATTLEVDGGRHRVHAPTAPLFIGNSGTSVRFLAALATLVPGAVRLEGDDAMARRPISDLVDGLRQLGIQAECPSGCPPLMVHGGRLRGGSVRMRGDRSSQYFSALMLVGAAAEGDLTIESVGALVSRPYVEITRRMVRDFGGQIDADENAFRVHASGGYRPRHYTIEPDASSASYAFAAAAATGGVITVPKLGTSAQQGDYRFTDVLEQMGARVERNEDETRVEGAPLSGVDVDLHHISDTVMTLAALAPLASGTTRIRNVANIRLKETDRLLATATELERLGQKVTQGDDFIIIEPRPIVPATVRCYADHRIAMSFAVLGMASGAVTIEDPACVAKTYPGFWMDLRACYLAAGAPAPW